MTKTNRCILTEPGMGSKQPVGKLFNMSTMTTITIINEFILVNFVCLGNVKNVLFIDLAYTSSLQFYHLLPAKH